MPASQAWFRKQRKLLYDWIVDTVDYGLVKTHYLVKFLKIILDLCVPIIVSSQKKYSV